ncbi:MAG: hypothetical protein OEM63_11885 [Gammaproteobacteria bacterium]|nr:hypothetical protein [Gammaproteobacteria bacterium]
MFARCRSLAASLVVLGLAGCGAVDSPTACDRACLIGIGDSYLAALMAHEPGLAPLADDLAFVENTTPTQVGRGLWVSASAIPSDYQIYVPDETAGTIGMMTLIGRRMPEGIPPALLAVRLKIEGGLITEAEHLVDDVPEVVNLASLVAPRPNLIAVVPENERMSRAELIAIAASYYEGLDTSDSSLVPFADDCERQENGMITAAYYLEPAAFDSEDVNGNSPPPVARDCAGQMDSARFAYIDSIDNRRVFAADPVQGLVMGLSHFRQSMTRGPLEMIAADGSRVLWEEQREPYDLPAAHIFKITNGQLHEVEAIGIFLPYQSPTGWE